jgi:RimJ/RimL family protein N-acetyltransferase
MRDGQAALAEWDLETGGQFSVGILRDQQLLGAVGVMPDGPRSVELAYWIRPEQRGQGLASRAVRATTDWVHRDLDVSRIWLEINPGNEASLRLAERVGYRFEQRLSGHCRDWKHEDARLDSWHDCLIWTHFNTGN